MNIVIPMAGKGERFSNFYNMPKPLISILNKPMIQWAVESCGVDGQYIFIIRHEHRQYDIESILRKIVPDCIIIDAVEPQQGQASAVLFAEEYINNKDYLLISNCDNTLEWDHDISGDNDGWLMVNEMSGNQYSYVKLDEHGIVIETAEKKQISNLAQAGIFAFKHGERFVKYCKQMVDKNLRVNNEFYICPVYNQGVEDNQIYHTKRCTNYYDFGTPDMLNFALEHLT